MRKPLPAALCAWLACLVLTSGLFACGNRGPLYLPEESIATDAANTVAPQQTSVQGNADNPEPEDEDEDERQAEGDGR